MAINYNWVISQLECKIQEGDLQEVVYTIHYRRQATEVDGATATGLWTMSGTPSSTKMMTRAGLVTYTNIPTGNSPLSDYASNQCVTKQAILGVY